MQTAKVQRLDEAALTSLVGADALVHLKRRVRGGESGFKGFRYEELFGAHRIARLIRKLAEEGTDAQIEWQSDGFVDDFVVRRDEKLSVKGYQLKNSPRVSWVAGEPPIETDFQRQNTVSEAEGYTDIRLRLVCSDEATANALAQAVPDGISEYSDAFFFPYGRPMFELIGEYGWMAEDFGYISKHGHPNRMQIGQVADVLMGAWIATCPRAYVSAVLSKARDMSPTLVRSILPDVKAEQTLTAQFRAILDALPGFEYAILKGFLHWSAVGGCTTGVLSYDCYSDKFLKLQTAIVQMRPNSFEEIEGVLT